MVYFTIIYVCIQIVLGSLAFGVLQRKNGWNTHTNTAASILTIFGVLGTFSGIFWGLWGFGIENIEGSIPGLLDGLKLAFLTSIVGIFSAIVLKVYAFVYQMVKSQDPEKMIVIFFMHTISGGRNLTILKT